MEKLNKEIDKVIPKKGMFKQAGYFLNKLIKNICEHFTAEMDNILTILNDKENQQPPCITIDWSLATGDGWGKNFYKTFWSADIFNAIFNGSFEKLVYDKDKPILIKIINVTGIGANAESKNNYEFLIYPLRYTWYDYNFIKIDTILNDGEPHIGSDGSYIYYPHIIFSVAYYDNLDIYSSDSYCKLTWETK